MLRPTAAHGTWNLPGQTLAAQMGFRMRVLWGWNKRGVREYKKSGVRGTLLYTAGIFRPRVGHRGGAVPRFSPS